LEKEGKNGARTIRKFFSLDLIQSTLAKDFPSNDLAGTAHAMDAPPLQNSGLESKPKTIGYFQWASRPFFIVSSES
jgi:hypothetical protein